MLNVSKILSIFNKNPLFLGLDIASSHLFLTGIQKNLKTVAIEFAYQIPLPIETIVEGKLVAPQKLISALRPIADKLKGAYIGICIPSNMTITRTVSLEKTLSEEEKRESIYLEMSRILPYAVEDSYLDFAFVNESPDDSQIENFTVVGIQKNIVHSYLEALKTMGLKPTFVTTSNYLLFNILQKYIVNPEVDAAYGIIKVDDLSVSYAISQNSRLIYYQETPLYPGDSLEENVTHILAGFNVQRTEHIWMCGEAAERVLPTLDPNIGALSLVSPPATLQLNGHLTERQFPVFAYSLQIASQGIFYD